MIAQLDEAQYWALAAVMTGLLDGTISAGDLERLVGPRPRGWIPTEPPIGDDEPPPRLRALD